MRAKLEEILFRVAIDTLEKLAFMFAFPGEDKENQQKGSMAAGSVSFTGHFSGMLVMTISIEVLQELSVNMLGLEDGEEIDGHIRSDALKETINVICGNLLPAIAGDKVIFDIDVPRILPAGEKIRAGAGIPDGLAPSARVNLKFDEGQCVFFLFLDGEMPKEVVSL